MRRSRGTASDHAVVEENESALSSRRSRRNEDIAEIETDEAPAQKRGAQRAEPEDTASRRFV